MTGPAACIDDRSGKRPYAVGEQAEQGSIEGRLVDLVAGGLGVQLGDLVIGPPVGCVVSFIGASVPALVQSLPTLGTRRT